MSELDAKGVCRLPPYPVERIADDKFRLDTVITVPEWAGTVIIPVTFQYLTDACQCGDADCTDCQECQPK